jgi:hypothetical protein
VTQASKVEGVVGLRGSPSTLVSGPINWNTDPSAVRVSAPMIAIDGAVRGCCSGLRVVEESAHVGVQRALITFEGHDVIALLVEDLLGISRWQFRASTVTMVPLRLSIFNSLGTAVISFDFSSVAIRANTRR